ncbi:hypothetical protein JQS43_19720 [Natronosporangium hydrolyticum]|uniref:DUF8175 domain-containing protein n=1 Tax=Natronosporangium hydrolyticum TaxID=2811111 RepID=A0A895YJ15_9ACTN|nr:hypothetical protein [Natronosporangium hydrolyticum]QSB13768.1 hypothetical protein JQS43_19720 [Natronosporangium hydrolyticum]
MSPGLHRRRGSNRALWYAAVAAALAIIAVAAALHMRLSDGGPDPQPGPTGHPQQTDRPVDPAQPDSPPAAPILPDDELVWASLCGVPLPYSDRYGPHRREGDRGLGFAREPAGAVLAALHLAVLVSPQVGPDTFAPTLTGRVIGPDATVFAHRVHDQYEDAREIAQVPYGEPLCPIYGTVRGFQLDSFSPDAASLRLLIEAPGVDGVPQLAGVLMQLTWLEADSIREALRSLIVRAVTAWVNMPPPDITNPATILQGWMLPFTILVATGGILWQALLMILTRRGEPLINVIKGLVAVALWGVVAVTGTNLLLAFTDAYSRWILTGGLDGNADDLVERLSNLMIAWPGAPLALVLILGPIVMIANFFQLALLLFRGAAVIILTGLLQLAAAGSFTTGTSGWLRKVLTWHLALVLYKPLAATIYAIAFMLIGDEDNEGLQLWPIGMATLGMSIIALPALLRFLSWPVGGIQSGTGGLGTLAAAGGASLHAAASLRGVTDHARDMERRHTPNTGNPPSAPTSTASTPPTATPPVFTGPTPAAAAPAAGTGTAAAGTAASGTAASGTAASGATAGAAAASGPAAPVVAGVVAVGQATVGAVKKGAQAASENTAEGQR